MILRGYALFCLLVVIEIMACLPILCDWLLPLALLLFFVATLTGSKSRGEELAGD